MEYQHIRAAAYTADPSRSSFAVPMYTFALPAEWEQPLLELRRAGMTEREAAWRRTVPTQAVNQLMRATAPDIVTVDGTATFGSQSPWLYCEQEYPMSVMNTYIAAWLRNLGKNPDDPAAGAQLMDTFRDLGPALPHWQLGMVDLLEQELSPGGTALPANHVYRLLPEVLAGRIERQEPYEHNGERLMFRRVAQLPGARGLGSGGAELMSWPPRKIESGKAPYYYSASIRITVRTAPFSSVPRVHLATGIRRFVTGKVWMPYQRGVSVYLLPDTSLVPDGLSSPAFSVATIRWRGGTTDWSQGGVQGMLGYVTALDALPSVDRLVKEAEHWIGGREGLTLAVGHQAAMGAHPVGTGLMPSERRRLTEWAEQALAPELVPVPLLERSRYAGPPKRQLQPLPSIPKEEKKPGDRAAALGKREQRLADNSVKRRVRLAEALDGAALVGLVLYQTDDQRDRVLAAAEAGLGLAGHRREGTGEIWRWDTPELSVTLCALPLGDLGAPLGGERVPRRGKEHEQAIDERRRKIAAALAPGRLPVTGAQVAFVELEGEESFRNAKRRADPKHAIRLGCAEAGLVTQFLRPLDQDLEPQKAAEEAAIRAEAAWADGIRQTGTRFIPQHTLGDELIPPGLNQLAFHLVEQRRDGPTGKPQFTPVAVLIRPGTKCVLGKTADMHEWVPYPELLKCLTGRVRDTGLSSAAQQSAHLAAFVKKTVAGLRSAPTLVFVHAQDVRKRWPWLRNDGLQQDRLGLDGGPVQRVGLYGKQLRVVRVADNGRDETPQWWAEAEELDAKHKGMQRAGFAGGLWVSHVAGDSGRVFYSTAGKASTQTKLTNEDAKLTAHTNASGKNAFRPKANAWNPELLELTVACLQPGDDPEAWAAFVHQQRICDDDYRDVLGLPLVLHLARLADEYALPHDEDDTVDTDVKAEQEAADSQKRDEQLAFDFSLDDVDEE
ncbi:pPIWI_RE module domain-containing protein [Streptomyces yangpuensis]|uniref:pPIWI_RE module domain-containing protein n=1 Tax=Streptomyces yangpuensis TaxID=1648182 RepID=UPI00364F08FB